MNDLRAPQANEVLPYQLRLRLAQPFNRFPFSGAGRVNSEIQQFRSDRLVDGHIYEEKETLGNWGTVEHFIRLVDLLGKEVQHHADRATAQAVELSQIKSDLTAMRRLFGIEGIVQITMAPAEDKPNA